MIHGIGAAAIYGPGASKGVILVTTKRGTPGPARWTAFAESGPLIETTEFPANYGTLGVSTSTGAPVANCPLFDQASGSCTAVARQMWNPLESASPFRTGWSNSAGVSVSGGASALRYFAAIHHDKSDGVYDNDRERATNGRISLAFVPSPTVGVTLTGGYRTERLRHPSGSYIVAGLIGMSVDDPVLRGYRTTFNPAPIIPQPVENGRLEEQGNRTTVALNGVWRPRGWLRTSATVGFDRLATESRRTTPFGEFPIGSGNFFTGVARTSDAPAAQTAAIDAAASYRRLGMAMRSTVGLQYVRDDDRGNSFRGTEPSGEGFTQTDLSLKRTSTGLLLQQHLAWQDRLFVTGSLRADRPGGVAIDEAYSRSVEVSWIALDSARAPLRFLPGRLRFRAAYGHGGGHLIESVSARELRTSSETAERVEGIEAGVDAAMFADRLRLTATVYRGTNDQGLTGAILAPGAGAAREIWVNDARFRTSGIEGSVDARLMNRASVVWDLGLVVSAHDSEVRSFPGLPLVTGTNQRIVEGASIGEYRPLLYSYGDANADGLIGRDELRSINVEPLPVGSPFPEYEAALRTTAQVGKVVRLSAVIDRRSGQVLYNQASRLRCVYGPVCEEQHDPATSLADQAEAVAPYAAYIEPASYTKLREASAALALPRSWAALGGASAARVTVTGRNLFTWTSYSGLDPEIVTDRIPPLYSEFLALGAFIQPPLRSFAARLDLVW